MKALYERWTAISLPKRILGGMILGAVLGMVIPQAVGISILGNLFVNALKGIAPLLVLPVRAACDPAVQNSDGGRDDSANGTTGLGWLAGLLIGGGP